MFRRFYRCNARLARYEGPWSFLCKTMWSLTSPRADRISGPENFCSSARKDFFNNICQERTLAQNNKSLACNNKTSADCPVKAGSLVELRRCRQATWRVDRGRHSAAVNSPNSRSFFRAWQPRAKQGQTNEFAYSCC